jgi:hypothetical protein
VSDLRFTGRYQRLPIRCSGSLISLQNEHSVVSCIIIVRSMFGVVTCRPAYQPTRVFLILFIVYSTFKNSWFFTTEHTHPSIHYSTSMGLRSVDKDRMKATDCGDMEGDFRIHTSPYVSLATPRALKVVDSPDTTHISPCRPV